MAEPVHHYSVWFLSAEGTFGRHDVVAPETVAAFRRNAKLFFDNRPDVAAVAVFVSWRKVGGGFKATGATFLDNGVRFPWSFERFVTEKLSDVGLGANGKPFVPPPNEPGRGRRKKRPASVAGVLDKIKTRKGAEPCDPKFAERFHTVYVTENTIGSCTQADVQRALRRFERCDWGDVDRSTTRSNNRASRVGVGRMYGVYHSRRGQEFWVMADPHRNKIVVAVPWEL
jgi:hypothetical protein